MRGVRFMRRMADAERHCRFTRHSRLRGARLLPQDNAGRINSLDFHRREDLLVTAGDDDSVHLYNIHSGTMDKTVFSRKYGVAHIRFTHHPQSVVYASNKVQHSWRLCAGMPVHLLFE